MRLPTIFGKTAALDVLQSALNRCYDEDVRDDPQVMAAIEYLSRFIVRRALIKHLLNALDMPDPDTRWQAVNGNIKAIRRGLGR